MLADRVKNLRMARGWTQTELAERAHVSQQLIWKIERGKAAESRKLPGIADAFGISVEELLEQSVGADKKAARAADPPKTTTDAALNKLLALWRGLDGPGKRHVVRSVENELARIAQRPFEKGDADVPQKKRKAF